MAHYKSSIKIDNKDQLVNILNQQLADTIDLHSQVKQAHWNVKGPNFYALHEMFDEFASEILEFIDTIAERITALGGVAEGSLKAVSRKTRLKSNPDTFQIGASAVKELSLKYQQLGSSTREAIHASENLEDAATADLFTEVVRRLDKTLWMLEAHIQ
ncbi:DNA starvation/stationary phase protection protein Dps [Flavivirga rizhaonensis]|uniref:DNA starvation/stationary phase protection protein Dps n=1 Tax=Flavivirga rizhaonensis TaxID=2559571 RepID=A0A4S1DV57_9FLAO|nr:DNA starvation/stationary phase protection protein Dps [Flavivirga rizhaonensis]TGV01312.1 DNA starvation/stationary phase protection protein Dps [Flavivirga rizhaonensis]